MRGHLADVLLENPVDTEFHSPVGGAAYRRVTMHKKSSSVLEGRLDSSV